MDRQPPSRPRQQELMKPERAGGVLTAKQVPRRPGTAKTSDQDYLARTGTLTLAPGDDEDHHHRGQGRQPKGGRRGVLPRPVRAPQPCAVHQESRPGHEPERRLKKRARQRPELPAGTRPRRAAACLLPRRASLACDWACHRRGPAPRSPDSQGFGVRQRRRTPPERAAPRRALAWLGWGSPDMFCLRPCSPVLHPRGVSSGLPPSLSRPFCLP
jgi:hypothetical protein